MRILAACSLGGSGHLGPQIPFLDAARAAGHEVVVIAPAGLAAHADGHVDRFVVGGEPPESVVAPIRDRLPVADAAEASVLGNRELFGRLATAAMLPDVRRLVARWTPDLILRDPCEHASAIVAAERGIAVATVAIDMAEGEWRSIDVTAPGLDAHRDGLTAEERAEPYVTRFPASLDPSPFPDTRRYREPRPEAARPLPDWWDGSDAPLAYLTFGTVVGHLSDAMEMYRTAVRAVAGLSARVLLTVGRSVEPAQLGDVPPNVHVEPWVDQDDVLAVADLVVCHGGSGTTWGSLRAGVPLVVVPMFGGQFTNAEAVVRAGAGVTVDPQRDDRGDTHPFDEHRGMRTREAIDAVLRSSDHRRAAERVAAESESAPPVAEVLDRLVTAAGRPTR